MEEKKVRIVIDNDPDNKDSAVQVTPNQADGGDLHESYQSFKKAYDRMKILSQERTKERHEQEN